MAACSDSTHCHAFPPAAELRNFRSHPTKGRERHWCGLEKGHKEKLHDCEMDMHKWADPAPKRAQRTVIVDPPVMPGQLSIADVRDE